MNINTFRLKEVSYLKLFIALDKLILYPKRALQMNTHNISFHGEIRKIFISSHLIKGFVDMAYWQFNMGKEEDFRY